MPKGNAGDYLWFRSQFQDVSGQLNVAAATGDTTLVTARDANTAIFVQRIVVYIQTDAAQSMAFTDTAATPVEIAKVSTSPGASTRWDFDFGEEGIQLTQGKNFLMDVSAAGLVGVVKYYAYTKNVVTTSGLL